MLAALAQAASSQNDTYGGAMLFPNAATTGADVGDKAQGASDSDDTDSSSLVIAKLQSLYFAGKYDEVLEYSQVIDGEHLSKSQNLVRLKYTAAAFKDLAYHRKADSVVRLFRKKDPFYEPTDDDPVSFCKVFDNYYTMPKFSVWAAAGLASVRLHLDTVHIIIDTVQRTPTYKTKCYSVQLGFEYRPLRILSVSLAPAYISYQIERTTKRSDISTFYYKEDYSAIALPLIIEASPFVGRTKIEPSIYAGAQAKILVSDKSTGYEETVGTYTKIPGKTDCADTKNSITASLLGGIRLSVNRGRITFFGDLGIACDLTPHNDPSKKFENYSLLYANQHVPDIYRMVELSYKIGIKVNLKYKTFAKFGYGH